MKKPFTTEETRAKWKPRAWTTNNEDFISIKAYSGYAMALPDLIATEYLLKPDALDEELGLAVLESLRQSRFLSYAEEGTLLENVNENYKKWIQKLMDRYGYKTKRALFKNMKSCGISSHDGIITILPSHHEKLEAWSGEGIREEDYVKIPADSPPSKIGEALRLAFSRCTGLGV